MKRIYAILDTVSDLILGGLHLFPHDAPAVRFFSDLCSDPQTALGRHPADHSLVCLGILTPENHLVTLERSVVITGVQWLVLHEKAAP